MTLHEMMRADRRHMRAAAFTSMMMHIVQKHLRASMDDTLYGTEERDRRDYRDVLRAISYDLEELCRREGIEILSDRMREDIGLPPRGPDGWTVEEIIALEEKRLELMRAPIVMQVPLSSPSSKKEGE